MEHTPCVVNKDLEATLKYDNDRYDGVIVKELSLPDTKEEFEQSLKRSMRLWKANGRRGVWLKIPSSKVQYAAVAIDFGFVMHHAEKDYLMLTHWLSEEENKLPSNASHQVGVGCVVVNKEGIEIACCISFNQHRLNIFKLTLSGKMLAVQECNGPLKGLGIWKLPTGLADAREDIDSAARREVLEETGIDTDFIGIVSFQQAHNAQFGKSDMFFVCLLEPKTFVIKKQECEIFACEWIDLETYIGQEFFLKSPVLSRMNEIVADIVREKSHKNFLMKHELSHRLRPMSLYTLPSSTN
jgi:8-oxo-dGTP pyrophosphatase MutT (NUDIX family)